MRLIVLLSLLILAACTIRQESFAPNDEAPSGLSFTPANLNNPTGDDVDRTCRGGLAQGSRIDEYRDGTASLFCD
jgi:hypothetical protein